jgi:acyl-CoA reductase-like NAD-dependent aldehyde dehydrogenase
MTTTQYLGALINGQWTNGEGLPRIPVCNPCNGSHIGDVSACGAIEAVAGLEAAKSAQSTWSAMSIDDREKHISAYREKLLQNKSHIIDLLVKETGKVRSNADYDFTMLINCLGFHVEEVRRCFGHVIPSPDNSALSYTRYSPVGVVVCVLTWNFPLLNLAYKLGPVLATGCTCVIKPSEHTPLATSFALSLLADAGFPKGVVNCVNGTGIDLLEPLCSSKIPRLLTTIGSTAMGRRMIGYSASTVKRFSLELGGDAPVLVFADAKLDAAVQDVVGLKFANAGQICVSPNRVLVERSIYETFLTKACELASKYVLGSGSDHGHRDEVLQPVVSAESLSRLLGYVDDAKAKGARIVCGGRKVERLGYFMEPTIIADVTGEMAVQQEEVFGPIMPVRAFDSVEEAFAIANDSEVGLSSYVYTSSIDTTMRAEEELMTGNVCINGAHYSIELPHGGLKQSGYGKDISHLSLNDYYDVRRISLKRRRHEV